MRGRLGSIILLTCVGSLIIVGNMITTTETKTGERTQTQDDFNIWLEQATNASVFEVVQTRIHVQSYFTYTKTIDLMLLDEYWGQGTPFNQSIWMKMDIQVEPEEYIYFQVLHNFTTVGHHKVYLVLTDETQKKWYATCAWEIWEPETVILMVDQKTTTAEANIEVAFGIQIWYRLPYESIINLTIISEDMTKEVKRLTNKSNEYEKLK